MDRARRQDPIGRLPIYLRRRIWTLEERGEQDRIVYEHGVPTEDDPEEPAAPMSLSAGWYRDTYTGREARHG